jgi:hypothetical protein
LAQVREKADTIQVERYPPADIVQLQPIGI